MAIPTIAAVTPSAGLTGGRLLVTITGSNFQLPPPPVASGPTPAPNPSVEVLFGTTPAPVVRVLASSIVQCLAPSSDAGAVSITVRNIDQAGAVIAGETVTASAAFTYAAPVINTTPTGGGGTTAESALTRLVRALLRELKRQVIPNVELTVHTDYDDTPGGANVAMLSSLPGLALSGPGLRENRFFSLNSPRVVAIGDDRYKQLRAPYTVDLEFTLIGVDDSTIRLLNLMKEVVLFFHRNKYLAMACDPADPSSPSVRYEMEFSTDGEPKMAGATSNSNVRSFSGTFLVRGLDLDDADMSAEQTAALKDAIVNGVGYAAPGAAGVVPAPFIYAGQPGITTAGPVPSGQGEPSPGNAAGVVQIPPEE